MLKLANPRSAEFRVEFAIAGGYLSAMRRSSCYLSLLCGFALTLSAEAATGRILKVLPLFRDLKGRTALSPSLYDRDAYQAVLLQHPERRSGIRYAIEWKTSDPAWEPLKVQIELRGIAQGGYPRQLVLSEPVKPSGWLGSWTDLVLEEKEYKTLGEVTAWRVTLWEGSTLLGEQKSFLW
jgi:hypothetical protein